MKQKVLVAFDEYYNETFLLQGHVDLILAPIHEAEQEYYELLLKSNQEMYNRGKQQGERLVSNAHRNSMKAKKKTVDFLHDKDKPLELFGTIQSSEEYLEQYTFTATEKTMSRVDGEINKILTDGYKEGWGVKDVRNRIMQRYDQFSSWEANRIARTEMQTAHNMGVMQSFQELGVEYKEWRSAHDSRVRTSHIYMDGEIAPLDEPFSNGLMYPGDKSGRIEEWINCRCSMVPYLMPPGSVAPVGRGTFRASDLVSVSEPNYGKLLKEHTGGVLNWQQYKQVLHGKSLEQVLTGATVQATTSDEIPIEVDQKMNDFANEYLNSRQEHMQFFTKTSSSEVTHGHNTSVRRNKSQEEFMEKRTNKGEEIHAIHTHPNQHDMYTMLSHEDIIDAFLPWQHDGNFKSFSAENKRNRISIIRTRDDFLKIKVPSKVSSMIELDVHSEVNRAWEHYSDRMSEIRNAPDEEMLWKRGRRKELREQGLSSPEIAEILNKESKTMNFKTLEEIQDEEFPKIVSEMNEILNPFGLKLKVKYKN